MWAYVLHNYQQHLDVFFGYKPRLHQECGATILVITITNDPEQPLLISLALPPTLGDAAAGRGKALPETRLDTVTYSMPTPSMTHTSRGQNSSKGGYIRIVSDPC